MRLVFFCGSTRQVPQAGQSRQQLTFPLNAIAFIRIRQWIDDESQFRSFDEAQQ